MILVAKPSKPVTYTAKSTVRRQAVLREYDQEINALYVSVEASTQKEIAAPEAWDTGSSLSFVRTVIRSVMKKDVEDDADIFQYGCDR